MPRSLFEAYLAGEAGAFYARHVGDPRARARAVELAHRPLAPAVQRSLRQQQARLGPSAARDRALDALDAGDTGACCVVTGQQVGLFLGPLYTLHKAATAVRLAQELQRETGRQVVPIFWLQTEDHDLPEIAHCMLPREHGPPCTITAEIAADNRSSIAHLALPASMDQCLAQLARELDGQPHAQAHLARVQRHYAPGRSWGDAFAGLLAELFEPEGLLVLDPRTPELAREVAHVHRAALEHSDALAERLLSQDRALQEAGYPSTVHVRPDSPLSFYHPDGPLGPRVRLRKQGEQFLMPEAEAQRALSLSELCAALEAEPLCFSSSALLRPIVQDSLLPTAAYVGGPAEVAYFAQLPPLYAAYEMELSLVAPRARVRLIEPAAARLLRRLSLQSADAALPEMELLLRVSASIGSTLAPAAFEATLLEGFEATLREALSRLPPAARAQLGTQTDKTRAALRRTSGKLARSYRDALSHHDTQRVSEVQRLQQLLFPAGAPQERVYGLPYYAARYGDRWLVEQLLAHIDPFSTQIMELPL